MTDITSNTVVRQGPSESMKYSQLAGVTAINDYGHDVERLSRCQRWPPCCSLSKISVNSTAERQDSVVSRTSQGLSLCATAFSMSSSTCTSYITHTTITRPPFCMTAEATADAKSLVQRTLMFLACDLFAQDRLGI